MIWAWGKKQHFAESDLKLSSVSVGRMKEHKGFHPVSFLQRFHNAQGGGLSWSEMEANQRFLKAFAVKASLNGYLHL